MNLKKKPVSEIFDAGAEGFRKDTEIAAGWKERAQSEGEHGFYQGRFEALQEGRALVSINRGALSLPGKR